MMPSEKWTGHKNPQQAAVRKRVSNSIIFFQGIMASRLRKGNCLMVRFTGISTRILLLLFIAMTGMLLCSATFASSEKYDTFDITYFDSVPYISLVELAETYNVKITYDPLLLSMTVRKGGSKLTLSNLSRIAVFDGSEKNIILPARLLHGAMYAPIPTFLPLFDELITASLMWDEKKRAVRVSGSITNIEKVSYTHFSNGTLINISLSEPLKYTIELSDSKWLTVNFLEGSFNPDTLFSESPSPLILDKRCFQHGEGAQVSFLISTEVEDYSIPPPISPREMLISLHNKRASISEAPAVPPLDILPGENRADDKVWRIDTVIIDPGHGGKDPGAIGQKKTQEKDIVLKVALELKKIIDKRGEIKGVLTRNGDKFVSLKERARIASRENGKLFISIHANANKNKQVRGVEIYFLSVAKTEHAKNVANRENASVRFEENSEEYVGLFNDSNIQKDIMDIMNGIVSSVFLTESQDMCNILLEKACAETRFQKRGVRQAGFYVMLGTQALMPSVLAEIGYISNAREEKQLKRASYQKRIAQSIYDSIILFKQRHERGLFSEGE